MLGLIFLAAVFTNLTFWICLFSRLIWYQDANEPKPISHKPLDIIVVYKNAKAQVSHLVPQLLSQDYSEFQVIAVDDYSTDGMNWEDSKALHSPHFKGIKATLDQPGKKAALQEAIDSSRAEVILLTDADCYPNSQQWAKQMTNQISGPKLIVLGYSPTTPAAGWLNVFIRYETWMTAIQYLSYAIAGIPYMGVGRNICYQRSLVAGYKHDMTLPSGDDDLLVSALANKGNTAICISADAFVYTAGKDSIQKYLSQKARHMSTAPKYHWWHQLLLSIFAVSQILIYPLFLLAIILEREGRTLFLMIFITYCVVKIILSYFLMKKLKEELLILWAPLLDIALSIYYIVMLIPMLQTKKDW